MLRNSDNGFGTVTIALHWTIAVLILGLILAGIVMRRIEIDPALQFLPLSGHKSFGFTALGLAAFRMLWWLVETSRRLSHPWPDGAHGCAGHASVAHRARTPRAAVRLGGRVGLHAGDPEAFIST